MHRTETNTWRSASIGGEETVTCVVVFDEGDRVVSTQITTDEVTSLPFEMTPDRQDIIGAIERTMSPGRPRVQITIRRRSGKSRLLREFQRDPSMLPTALGGDARVLILTFGRFARHYPNHAWVDEMDSDMLRDYDALLFDDCFHSRLVEEFPEMPMIYVGSRCEAEDGFERVHVGPEMDARGWGI